MILKAYAIYDNKGLLYHAPFFMSTDGQAVRALSDLVNDNTTSIARHPGDYVLFGIGTYDDQKGMMQGISPLAHICDAISLVPLTPQLPLAASC